MAFSPFRAFRKHQKAFFAGLTIVCMLTFVLAGSMSRGGDFFSWIGSLIGGSREPKVAVLYGKPVYRAEILHLRSQRQLANAYMESASGQAHGTYQISLFQAFSKLDEPLRGSIQRMIRQWASVGDVRKASAERRKAYLQQLGEEIDRQLPEIEQDLIRDKKQAEAKELANWRERLVQDYLQIQRIKDKNELFFGGTVRFDDLIDFLIWKHEADRRGIQLTMADIRELVNRETSRRLTSTDFRNVENNLRENFHNIMNADTLRAGLADEFRVRIVKAAIMGEDASGVSTSITPYEFWQFYRDQRTENVIAVLPIPVRQKDFLDQAGQPKEEELKTLFAEGKDRESDPASDKGGFKVPPRIGVEWVSARADSEHYRKAAEITLAATQATLPFYYEAMLYQQYQEENWKYRLPSWTDDYRFLLHDSSVNRPENVAALVGQLAAGGSQPMAFSGGMSYMGTATSREVEDRLRIGLTMALSQTSPTPFTSAALAYYGTPKTEYRPMAELKEQLVEKLRKKTAGELVRANLEDLYFQLAIQAQRKPKPEDVIQIQSINRPECLTAVIGTSAAGSPGGHSGFSFLGTLGGLSIPHAIKEQTRTGADFVLAGTQPMPFLLGGSFYRFENLWIEWARKVIENAVAHKGFEHGFSSKLRNRYDIGEDAGLLPLKEAFLSSSRGRSQEKKEFSSLFWPGPSQQERGMYFPEIVAYREDRPFLYWKTEEKPAYVPTFEEAKDKVIAWWKFDKARGLAEKEAEQVMAEAKGKPDAERRLKDGSKHSEKWFYLTDQEGYDKVAKMVKPLRPSESPFSVSNWVPFRFSKSQIEYPPSGLLDMLIALKEPGEVVVFHDQPKATYFVAALVDHYVPKPEKLYKEYDLGPTAFFQEIEETTHYRREFEKNLVAELRREAGLEIIEENRDLVDQTSRSNEE